MQFRCCHLSHPVRSVAPPRGTGSNKMDTPMSTLSSFTWSEVMVRRAELAGIVKQPVAGSWTATWVSVSRLSKLLQLYRNTTAPFTKSNDLQATHLRNTQDVLMLPYLLSSSISFLSSLLLSLFILVFWHTKLCRWVSLLRTFSPHFTFILLGRFMVSASV